VFRHPADERHHRRRVRERFDGGIRVAGQQLERRLVHAPHVALAQDPQA